MFQFADPQNKQQVAVSPLSLAGDTWRFTAIAASTGDSSVSNTTVETNFSPASVGSRTIAANSMIVGQSYKVIVMGILSTA